MRKDYSISKAEKTFMLRIGKTLGFDKEFVEDCIRDIMYNEFVEDAPPKFTDPVIAKSFIIDGLKLISADSNLDPNEVSFLHKTAETNLLPPGWSDEILKSKPELSQIENSEFEVTNFINREG